MRIAVIQISYMQILTGLGGENHKDIYVPLALVIDVQRRLDFSLVIYVQRARLLLFYII